MTVHRSDGFDKEADRWRGVGEGRESAGDWRQGCEGSMGGNAGEGTVESYCRDAQGNGICNGILARVSPCMKASLEVAAMNHCLRWHEK